MVPQMPLMELFGPNLRWMLRDVIRYNGNYNDMYHESHPNVSDSELMQQVWSPESWIKNYWGPGRNTTAEIGSPMNAP